MVLHRMPSMTFTVAPPTSVNTAVDTPTAQKEQEVLLLLEYDAETHSLKFLTSDMTPDEDAFSFELMDTRLLSARFRDLP